MARPEEEIRREVDQRLQELEYLRQQAVGRGLKFTALTEEELTRKASRETARSPYIFAQGWTSGTTPGSTANYTVSVANPDPDGYYPLFVTIFFGLANFLTDVGGGPPGRNPEWPYVSSEAFSLLSGQSANQSFTYTTPTTVPLGTYLGNAVFWRGEYHDQGSYLDRGLFEVTLF
jgi:hypothetical protein